MGKHGGFCACSSPSASGIHGIILGSVGADYYGECDDGIDFQREFTVLLNKSQLYCKATFLLKNKDLSETVWIPPKVTNDKWEWAQKSDPRK